MNHKTHRPRLYVFKSNKHIYAQIIDDKQQQIVCSSSSIATDLKPNIKSNTNCEIAYMVGEHIGRKAINTGINKVLFDRGKRIYHGQIKALADGARKEGIIF